MKIKYLTGIVLGLTLLGCEKYTDVKPKGFNLLNTATDLDRHMNFSSAETFDFARQTLLINDSYPSNTNVPQVVTGNVKNLDYALLTYDETLNRSALTVTDPTYEGIYGNIVKVCNIVLNQADEASGDKALLSKIKAESYVLRAYMHYLLVNVFAKAYDKSMAATDGGIPYPTDLNLETVNEKLSVARVYENIIKDLDAAFALNSLSAEGKNNMRVGRCFALAVRARVMMSMGNYSEALKACNEALAINSFIDDHNKFLPNNSLNKQFQSSRENLFYASQSRAFPAGMNVSREILGVTSGVPQAGLYESANILRYKNSIYDYSSVGLTSRVSGTAWFYPLGTTYDTNSGGMTTSDLYLMKAECLIRAGDISGGMDIINLIRKHRNDQSDPAATDLSAATEGQAILHLQRTARIEYLFSWQNFVEIKRWNREGKYPITITRRIVRVASGNTPAVDETFTLNPNSPLWIFAFPTNSSDFNPTLTPNY
ncbi:RagB/SusD family nutrient uptake outer membrane protein [Parapedobacter tibetensis]|uniref:RagB/SusD family nutrient uptake outer membrane protein n=1 Tax=Parapedobacter tibetensis TaxID=2972951 RepID=UPI00214D3539|nr:RagB/SusD family nutrient uptake outer membrane protein [Parapedobacter tibetensis]